jgi:hypothetical protein
MKEERSFSEAFHDFISFDTLHTKCDFKGLSDNAKTLFSWSAFLMALIILSKKDDACFVLVITYMLSTLSGLMILVAAKESAYLYFGCFIRLLKRLKTTEEIHTIYTKNGWVLRYSSYTFAVLYLSYLILAALNVN